MLLTVTSDDYRSYRDATGALQLREESESAFSLRLVPVRVHLDKGTPIQMPIAPLQNGAFVFSFSHHVSSLWVLNGHVTSRASEIVARRFVHSAA